MKISWGHLAVAVISLAALTGAYRLSPAVRTAMATQGREWLGWTDEARRGDPVGFTSHVERKLQSEVAMLRTCRFELVGNTDQLSGKIREQEAFRDQARKLADEFRSAFQTARQGGSFPFVVRNAAYTEEQSVTQVSLLLAQAEGFDKSVKRLQQIQDQSNKRLQEIVVRQNATEAQLAAIGAQRELLRARELTTVGEALIAQVDELFDINQRVLTENPVRTIAELLSAETQSVPHSLAHQDAARRFLDEVPVRVGKPTVEEPTVVELAPEAAKVDAPKTKLPVVVTDVDVEFDGLPSNSSVIQEQSTSPKQM